ncbi:DUF1326 domain-containing protein [Pseudonocardia sp.]|uniref:DUF1326 domain-containing protein n=1 Tax=Pseudonocardia sp. TaxID=60912 RepID=UPI003D0C73B2
MTTTESIPAWTLQGDWFDVCSCTTPCPCTFAQSPTNNTCTAIFAYRITGGRYGDTELAGLNVGAVLTFEGNIWGGETSCTLGLLVDDRADPQQMQALLAIFGGAAGGWPAMFASLIGDFRGVEVAPMRIEIAEDLSSWSVEVSGWYSATSSALTGPTSDPTKRVQLLNAPGAEVGPAEHSVTTWGVGEVRQAAAGLFGGLSVEMATTSSKHIPFDWSGPGS